MKHLLCIAALLGSASLTACAQAPQAGQATTPSAKAAPAAKEGTADARARDGLQKLNPNIKVDYLGASPLPGFRALRRRRSSPCLPRASGRPRASPMHSRAPRTTG